MNVLARIASRLRFEVYAPLRLGQHSSYYLSCSQFGEDMIARHLLATVKDGFFVDIGAHHPVYYSNTYHFYRRGWRGINVDAQPGSMAPFRVLRPRDINIEACVDAESNQVREFFVFEPSALNTVSAEEASRATKEGRGRLIARHQVQTVSLADLLDQYLPAGRRIDLLSVDVEGLDEVILKSHDFHRYCPRVVMFERHHLNSLALGADPLINRLREFGYELVGVTGPSVVMRSSTWEGSP